MNSEQVYDRKLRIFIASRAPFFGGAEQALERLAVELNKRGHEVLVVVGEDNDVFARIRGRGINCEVCSLPMTDKWRWFAYRKAKKKLRKIITGFSPDIVHSNDLPTHQIVSDAAGGLGVPRVCHHRFLYSGRAIDWLIKYGAECHILISNGFMEQMCSRSKRLADSSRALVHDGLPVEKIVDNQSRIDAKRQVGISLDKTVVTFTGQVIPRKGVGDLINAWAMLDKGVRGCAELVIVGDDLGGRGSYRLEMENLGRSLGVDVKFVGFQEDVKKWLIASDVVVLPSHEEPLGLTVMEGMAFGLPTIGSDVGGIPDMIEHEKTGLLFAPGDCGQLSKAIERLLSDQSLRDEFGKNAWQRCKELFSIERHVDNILQEYGRVLENWRDGDGGGCV